jgi:hypothetical protein
MKGDNPPKLVGQWQWLATREGLGERVAYSGTAFLGGLWILVCNERGARDPAISIEAEPNRNLSGRPFLGREPAPLQRATKIVRIGNRNLPRNSATQGINRNVRGGKCYQDQEALTRGHHRPAQLTWRPHGVANSVSGRARPSDLAAVRSIGFAEATADKSAWEPA